ncbi:hypothetical protein [Winogradskyella pulchriflava]|uniref:Uncharacterized protein n=1 Tax=Winogradskyella pulchriflava TaxID=1110688 RepID=A0ABV6Q4C8_9FLAO
MIEKFIKALEEIKNSKITNEYELQSWQAKAINIIVRIYGNNSKQEEQINKIKYKRYMSVTIDGHTTGGGNNASLCSRQATELISSIINDLESFGIPETQNTESGSGINISLNQMQSQTVNVNIIWESIEDELTGKQLKELKKILKGKDKPESKKKKILEKLAEFGTGVASNILSTILTNPGIISGL